jgi:2',3'-cyclic-nucleotide 2'-phosphodiesterase (5'-nucleotidase family)
MIIGERSPRLSSPASARVPYTMQRRILFVAIVAMACAQRAQTPSSTTPVPATTPAANTSALPSVRLRIIATNDFHGALEARPDSRGVLRGGGANVAAMAERLAAACPQPCETLLLDGGDLSQGTLASNLAFGRPVYAMYNSMGYAAVALGNHEFDWGQDTLKARMRDARFAVLGANVRDTSGRDVEWIRNDTIVERGPWKIGIIGIARLKTPEASKAVNMVGLRFDPAAPIIDSIAPTLRARGANAVIVIAHEGAFCENRGRTACKGEIVDIANALHVPIDAIVAGHTHSAIDAIVHGIPIVQSFKSGSAISTIDLGATAPKANDATSHIYDVIPDSVTPNATVAAIVADAVKAIESIRSQPIASFAAGMPKEGPQHALGNFITDAMRWSGKSDIAVINNGGIRAGFQPGQANYGAFFEVHPFGNVLKRVTVKGSVLRQYLERIVGDAKLDAHISGAVVEYDPSQSPGSRVVSVRLSGGRSLDNNGTYTVTLNDFMADGGDRFGFVGKEIRKEDLNIVDLDALVAYARSQPQPIQPPAGLRLVSVTR